MISLLPGGTASFANYTSYSRGINGIMIDIAGLWAMSLSAADFDFKVGNSDTVSAWAPLATMPTVSMRFGAGVAGSTRVTLLWPAGSISKQWLQVTVKSNENTGLAMPDVFYFGNAIGESGSGPDARVTVRDEIAARNNPYSSAAFSGIPTPVTNRWDYNRDGNVSAQDQIVARNNQTTVAAQLRLINVPAGLGGASLTAQSLADDSGIVAGGLAIRELAQSWASDGFHSFSRGEADKKDSERHVINELRSLEASTDPLETRRRLSQRPISQDVIMWLLDKFDSQWNQ